MLEEDRAASSGLSQQLVLEREQLESCLEQMRANVPEWSEQLQATFDYGKN